MGKEKNVWFINIEYSYFFVMISTQRIGAVLFSQESIRDRFVKTPVESKAMLVFMGGRYF